MSEAITTQAVANTANFLTTLCLHKRDGCRDKTAPEHRFQGWGLVLWLPAPEPFAGDNSDAPHNFTKFMNAA